MLLDNVLSRLGDAFGFVAVKSGRFDLLLKFSEPGVSETLRGAIFFEELRRHDVDALISALGRQDRGDQQFERVGMIQFAVSVRIGLLQASDDFRYPRLLLINRFFRHYLAGSAGFAGTSTVAFGVCILTTGAVFAFCSPRRPLVHS